MLQYSSQSMNTGEGADIPHSVHGSDERYGGNNDLLLQAALPKG